MLTIDEKNHIYYYNGVRLPSVTQILSTLGVAGNYSPKIPAVKNAATRGSCVHKILELGTNRHSKKDAIEEYLLWCENNDHVPYSQMKGYVDAGFSWIEEYGDRIVSSEKMAGNEYYAGTIDAIVEFDNATYVVDWKTSRQVHNHHKLQIAGYCYLEGLKNGIIVHLKEDGTYDEHFVGEKQVEIWSRLLGIFCSALSDDDKKHAAKAAINESDHLSDDIAEEYLYACAEYDAAKERKERAKEALEASLIRNGRHYDGSHDRLYAKWVFPSVAKRIDMAKIEDFAQKLPEKEREILEKAIKASTKESKRKGHYKITMRG